MNGDATNLPGVAGLQNGRNGRRRRSDPAAALSMWEGRSLLLEVGFQEPEALVGAARDFGEEIGGRDVA